MINNELILFRMRLMQGKEKPLGNPNKSSTLCCGQWLSSVLISLSKGLFPSTIMPLEVPGHEAVDTSAESF